MYQSPINLHRSDCWTICGGLEHVHRDDIPAYNDAMTMQDAQLLERITTSPRLMGGKPTVRGLRITVEQLLLALAHGVTEPELLDDYPELNHDDISAALLYAGTLVAEERVIPITDAA